MIFKNYLFLLIFFILLFSCSAPNKEPITLIKNSETSDTVKDNIIEIDTTSLSVSYNAQFSYRIFYTTDKATGFGYEIFKSKKRYIYQPNIPAISGYKAFRSKEEAQKIVEFAIKKMIKNDGLPTIYIKELDSLKINY